MTDLYDGIVISGLPRSGTSYLAKALSSHTRSDQFSDLVGPIGITRSPLVMDESPLLGVIMSLGGNPWPVILEIMRVQHGVTTGKTLPVVKHPQLVFFDLPQCVRLLHVVCVRNNFDRWFDSWHEHTKGAQVQSDRSLHPNGWLAWNWPEAEWSTPSDYRDRARTLYRMFMERCHAAAQHSDTVLWEFEFPEQSNQALCGALTSYPWVADLRDTLRTTFRPTER